MSDLAKLFFGQGPAQCRRLLPNPTGQSARVVTGIVTVDYRTYSADHCAYARPESLTVAHGSEAPNAVLYCSRERYSGLGA